MIGFPSDYKLRSERDFFNDCLVYGRLNKIQKNLSHAMLEMNLKDGNQTIDKMISEEGYWLYRVYDIDGKIKYKLWSDGNVFLVERLDHAKMVDEMFKQRNTPMMHIRHTLHLISKPDKNFGMVQRAFLCLMDLPYDLKMCKLNKTR